MSYLVQGRIDDHRLSVAADTAKKALAKSLEWQVVEKFLDVSIYDGSKNYSIDDFATAMALQEIANSVALANDNEASG